MSLEYSEPKDKHLCYMGSSPLDVQAQCFSEEMDCRIEDPVQIAIADRDLFSPEFDSGFDFYFDKAMDLLRSAHYSERANYFSEQYLHARDDATRLSVVLRLTHVLRGPIERPIAKARVLLAHLRNALDPKHSIAIEAIEIKPEEHTQATIAFVALMKSGELPAPKLSQRMFKTQQSTVTHALCQAAETHAADPALIDRLKAIVRHYDRDEKGRPSHVAHLYQAIIASENMVDLMDNLKRTRRFAVLDVPATAAAPAAADASAEEVRPDSP